MSIGTAFLSRQRELGRVGGLLTRAKTPDRTMGPFVQGGGPSRCSRSLVMMAVRHRSELARRGNPNHRRTLGECGQSQSFPAWSKRGYRHGESSERQFNPLGRRQANNELAIRALKKWHLDIEQATSTELALAAMQRRHFDLVISDMGRRYASRATMRRS